MHLAALLFATHGVGYFVAALLGVIALGTTVLTYTGTTLSPMDQAGGSFGPYVDQDLCGLELHAATGAAAIAFTHGKVVVTAAGVAALTLAAPVAGSPANGGNDGQSLKIIDTSGHAHTVTTPANGINGVHHILTSAGNVGDDVTLTAYNGVWYVSPTTTAWTIS
jgi:hypothetical protein